MNVWLLLVLAATAAALIGRPRPPTPIVITVQPEEPPASRYGCGPVVLAVLVLWVVLSLVNQ